MSETKFNDFDMTPERWEGLLKASAEEYGVELDYFKRELAVMAATGPAVVRQDTTSLPHRDELGREYYITPFLLIISTASHMNDWNKWYPTQDWPTHE